MEALHPLESDGAIAPDAQARLDQFKAFAARHPRLDQVEHEVLHAIWEPAGFAYLLVYGPSGVGKSTMIHHIVRRLNTPAGGTGHRPLLLLEVRPPDGELFHRTDYYRTALRCLGQTSFERRMMVDLNTEHAWEKKGGRRTASRYHDEPELRYALEDALRTQHVRAVVLDEAQHLMQGGQAATALDQLDWIKSMTNVTGVLHILLGTYSLVHFCNLNGQTARRGLEVHFPRYHFREESDGQAFRNVLLTLLAQVPLIVDQAALLQHWPYFYARSLGCVGVLKEWLVRATALALREGSEALTLPHLERRALSDAKCARMAADIQEGEQTLHSSEEHRQRLLALLGMSDIPSLTSDTAMPSAPIELARAGAHAASPHPSVRPPVGQRRPQRDPVGAMAPPAPPTKCLGAGALDVDARGLTQSAITQVECPVCGAVRTVQLKAQRVILPAHAPLKTHTTCKGARWIRGETGWALAQP
jgi:DNA polymerase III delta prime subunit